MKLSSAENRAELGREEARDVGVRLASREVDMLLESLRNQESGRDPTCPAVFDQFPLRSCESGRSKSVSNMESIGVCESRTPSIDACLSWRLILVLVSYIGSAEAVCGRAIVEEWA